MRRRIVYDTGETIGKNRSKEQNMTATQQKNTLTSSQKIVLRLEPPDLRHSKAITTIVFKTCIDWCMIKVQQWVRRWGRKNKMWRHQTPQKNLPRHKNSLCHSSRRNHAAPRPLPSFASKPTSIDVKYRWKNGLEEVERTKCGGTRPDKRTNLDTKNHFATGANGPTPLQGHCHHSHRNLNRLMYNTVETNG